MRIPLELAHTLAAVVDEGTLDAAARALHITPSAVSQRIKTLEEILGRVVLVRSRPARATPDGVAVVRLARQVALLEQDTLADVGAADAGTRVSIPLAVNADSLATWFLPPLARLSESRGVVFEVHRDDQDRTAALLESGTVMGAVTSRKTAVAGCRVSRLGAMRYEAVAAPAFVNRWLADGVNPISIASAPVVDFDRRDDLQTGWLRAQTREAIHPPRHYIPASAEFAEAVRTGLGWGMLPSFQSDAALASGELVRLGGAPTDVELYWQQWNLRSPLLDAVAETIIHEGRRVLGSVDEG